MNEQKKLKDARVVLELLESGGFAARFAGGCVRDRLMGRAPSDYDVATTAKPEAVCHIFIQKGYKVIPTGLDHGTVTVITKSGPVEVTTLRFDVATDGRHATVEFDNATFEDDGARRDFTVNALFEDKEGNVYDYFGGKSDLQSRRLRFVGEAGERIREDYLRILRLFRFWAKLEFTPDAGALAAVGKEVEGLSRVSIERITAELLQLLACSQIEAPLRALSETGTLAVLLRFAPHSREQLHEIPFATIQQLGSLDKEWRTIARFAALMTTTLPNSSAVVIGEHFRLSRLQIRQINVLMEADSLITETGEQAADHLQLIDTIEEQVGAGGFRQLFLPYVRLVHSHLGRTLKKLQDIEHTEATKGHLRTADMPIDGKLLIKKLNLSEGVVLGQLLEVLKRGFRNSEWQTEAEGLAIARKYI